MESMSVPHNSQGDLDLAVVAKGILMAAQRAPEGETLALAGRLDDDDPAISFSAVYDGHGGLIVQKACLVSRFNASLYLALETTAPAMVRTSEVNPFAQGLPKGE